VFANWRVQGIPNAACYDSVFTATQSRPVRSGHHADGTPHLGTGLDNETVFLSDAKILDKPVAQSCCKPCVQGRSQLATTLDAACLDEKHSIPTKLAPRDHHVRPKISRDADFIHGDDAMFA
jgi:hypothetical protein